MTQRATSARVADPITTEVVRNGLVTAAEQMKVVLCRAAYSPVIYEMYDFACALFDREVRVLGQGRGMPLFLGTLGPSVKAIVDAVGGEESLRPGDVLFSTYGYEIGSHQQDAAVVLPGFHNHDLSIFKNFALRGSQKMQFRWEIYNLFNHPQWDAVDTSAQFDAAGNQTDVNFGKVTSARTERRMVMSLRYLF